MAGLPQRGALTYLPELLDHSEGPIVVGPSGGLLDAAAHSALANGGG